MNTKSFVIVFAVSMLGFSISNAQAQLDEKTGNPDDSKPEGTKMNIVKLNLPALVLKNFSFQYERILNKRFSASLGIRVMPNTGLPLKNTFTNIADVTDSNATATINNLKVSNFAITPEFRYYVGKKGYGRGFYIAPYYRYASFKSDELPFEYTDVNDVTQTIKLGGKITSNSGGLMFGAQWFLGKYVTLDWWILGAHYGANKGTFTGTTSTPLTTDEQNDIKTAIDDFDLPFGTKTSVVNANGATINFSGPWAGARGALTIGIRF